MRKFFIVLTVLLAAFTIWCWLNNQPSETVALNGVNTWLSFRLFLFYLHKEDNGQQSKAVAQS